MARRTICLMPPGASDEAVARRDCRRRDHRHITEPHYRELRDMGLAEWSGGAARMIAVPAGSRLSLAVGAYLAQLVYRKNALAIEILREIRRK